ncbi:thiol-disulfide isomerase/thioredoxin [Conyzicola lurida]|uniref:Thiol-disulfide isomerase/thioredoxin n=1 Tax=Conyzicola lurida TaxID=1172621 RepID=A0A841AM39_9MICO|nr:thioredoxin family protein [Conyzicola lurida]MBB5842801.1 thiol-disulfide isomerase/thioredoxin [Conyzicola lurida]
MTPLATTAVLVGLVALATALGLLWRWQNGRLRTAAGTEIVAPGDIHGSLGGHATLLQFSSELCTPCRATHRVLESLAAESSGVAHVELDITRFPDLTDRFGILQTPTTLILDRDGAVRARIGGAARAADVRAHLDLLPTA